MHIDIVLSMRITRTLLSLVSKKCALHYVCISKDSQVLRTFLKWSKTDQYSRDIEVFVGSNNNRCPVRAVTSYISLWDLGLVCFFVLPTATPLPKPDLWS